MAQAVTFDRAGAKRIVAAVRAVESSPLGLLGPGRRVKTRLRDNVAIHNVSGATIPANGIVWLRQYDATERRWNVKAPEYGGVSRIGIACAELSNNKPGSAWVVGAHAVLCSAYADLAWGARIGAQNGSHYAQADELGPFEVLGPLPAGEQPAGLPAGVGLLRVSITGRRGDHWITSTRARDFTVPALTLYIRPPLVVEEAAAGVALISLES